MHLKKQFLIFVSLDPMVIASFVKWTIHQIGVFVLYAFVLGILTVCVRYLTNMLANALASRWLFNKHIDRMPNR